MIMNDYIVRLKDSERNEFRYIYMTEKSAPVAYQKVVEALRLGLFPTFKTDSLAYPVGEWPMQVVNRSVTLDYAITRFINERQGGIDDNTNLLSKMVA